MFVCVTPLALWSHRDLLPHPAAPGQGCSRQGGEVGAGGGGGVARGALPGLMAPQAPSCGALGDPSSAPQEGGWWGGGRTGTSGFPRWNRVARGGWEGGWEGPICAPQAGAWGSGGLTGSALPSPQPLLPHLSARFPRQDHLLPRTPVRTSSLGGRTQPRQLQVTLPSRAGCPAPPPAASPRA